MGYAVTILDNKDGTGLTAQVAGTDPAATNTVYVADTALGQWVQAASRIGNGIIPVPVGEAVGGVSFTRSYWVRVDTNTAGVINAGTPVLVTPTRGYKTYAFEELLQAKHALINANIALVGGRVFHCIDPRVTKVIPELPAIFLFQANPETVGIGDNRSTLIDLPIACHVADAVEADWVDTCEWWLYARQAVFDLFHRQSTESLSTTGSGRRWRVEPGPLLADGDPQSYLYRASLLTLHADVERPIGG